MLDLASEVVVPAFINHDVVYEFMSSRYFLYNTHLVSLDYESGNVLCMVGTFIQTNTIKSEQIFDEEKGLVPHPQEMPTATSAVFVLVLNTHKLLFYHQTPGAPGLGTFKTTVERNIRLYYNRYTRDRLDENLARLQAQGKVSRAAAQAARSSIRQQFPRMSLEVVPLATEEDFTNFIMRLSLLTYVKIELLTPNDENHSDPFFAELNEKKEAVNSDKTSLIHDNKLGLIKEQVAAQLSSAATQGNSEISIRGRDEAGDEIKRDASHYKTRAPLADTDQAGISDSSENIFRRMFDAFQRFVSQGIHIDENDEANTQSNENSLAAIRERFDIRSG